MFNKFIKWIRIHYDRIINSIAFYPALIAIGFLVLSYIMLKLDFSDFGKSLKSQWSFSLKDAETARTIAGTIAAGILSLAVFSFSMVMILLNQVASYMSNRVLEPLDWQSLSPDCVGILHWHHCICTFFIKHDSQCRFRSLRAHAEYVFPDQFNHY